MTQREDLEKMVKRSSRLRIIGLSLIIISFVAFIYYSTRQQRVIESKDTLLAKIKDSVMVDSSEYDTLKLKINEFLRLRDQHKADSLEKLYADTLARYFKNLILVPKYEATKSDSRYWKKFKNDKYFLTQPMKISIDSNERRVELIGKQARDGEHFSLQRVELKFDDKYKIYSVRAFLMTEQ